ncbi:hypothetical protein CDAR_605661 [Caerostris darwini]|uniref:Uncharacterized protein n=1 Tax=Caerostris darwini TaxID=1538125 RepID=A0AAV4V985_9ARAC|nr:hypothetical protein CDAR_605661 [Caerostris darwini]
MRPREKSLFNSIGTLFPPLQIPQQRDTQRCLHSPTTFISRHPNKRYLMTDGKKKDSQKSDGNIINNASRRRKITLGEELPPRKGAKTSTKHHLAD